MRKTIASKLFLAPSLAYWATLTTTSEHTIQYIIPYTTYNCMAIEQPVSRDNNEEWAEAQIQEMYLDISSGVMGP